jgi:transcriptional antiterminator NusG
MIQDSTHEEIADSAGNSLKVSTTTGEGVPSDSTAVEGAPTGAAELNQNPNLQWFAVVTQSNMEKRAKSTLEERIKKKKLGQYFGRIIIPTMTTEVLDEKGKKKKVESKMMPGYIFIEMEMIETAYHCVKDTPKVSGFLGATQSRTPPPLTAQEIDRVINRAAIVAKEEAAKPRAIFEKGEKVKVIDGPFTNFVGDVDEVKNEKQKLRLLISVFGRPTPVEIEFSKVERIDPNAQPTEA